MAAPRLVTYFLLSLVVLTAIIDAAVLIKEHEGGNGVRKTPLRAEPGADGEEDDKPNTGPTSVVTEPPPVVTDPPSVVTEPKPVATDLPPVDPIDPNTPSNDDIVIDNVDVKSAKVHWKCDTAPYKLELKLKESDATCYGDCKPTERSLDPVVDCSVQLDNLCPDALYEVIVTSSAKVALKATKEFRTKTDVPDKLEEIELGGETTKSVTVTWKAPGCPSKGKFDYSVIYKADGEAEETLPVTDDKLTATVTGLEGGREYSFKVRACLEEEPTRCVETEEAKTTTEPERPGPPKGVIITYVDETGLVTWVAPDVKRTYKYKARLSESATEGDFTDVGTQKDYAYHLPLQPFTTYYAVVIAYVTDTKGTTIEGEPSAPVDKRTNPAAPGPVSLDELTVLSSSSIKATWKKPVQPNGPINGYKVTVTGPDYTHESQRLEPTVFEYSVTDLEAYRDYTFQVVAQNIVGGIPTSGAAATKQAKTAMDKPSAPTGLQVNVKEDTKMTIEWSAPKDPKGPLDGYTVIYERVEAKEGDPAKEIVTKEAATSPFTAVDLIPYRKYSFKVHAYHKQGTTKIDGDDASAEASTQIGVPKAPSDVKVQVLPAQKQLLVTWGIPVPMTGPTSYVVLLKTAEADPSDRCQKVDKLVWKETTSKKLDGWEIKSWDEHKWDFNRCYKATVTATTDKGSQASPESGITETQDATKMPSEPKQVTLKVKDEKSIEVTWVKPDRAEGDDLIYLVRCEESESKQGDFVAVPDPNILKYDCANLKPYTNYSIAVMARVTDPLTKAKVDGTPSADQEAITKATNPGDFQVTELKAEALFTLESVWGEPEPANGPIDFYLLTLTNKLSKEVREENFTGETNEFKWEGLDPYSEYTFSVTAVNIVDGLPKNSNPSTRDGKTWAYKPSEPIEFKSTSVDSGSADLEWTAPAKANGPLSGYTVEYCLDENIRGDPAEKCEQTIFPPASDKKYKLSGLLAWRRYNLTLNAYNTEDNRTYPSEDVQLQVITTIGVPKPVSDVLILAYQTGETRVHFLPGTPISGPTNYTVHFEEAEPVNMACDEKQIDFQNVFNVTVDSWFADFAEVSIWEVGKCYRAKVIANTEVGDAKEAASPVQSTIGMKKIPSQPLNVRLVKRTSRSITLTWDEPLLPNDLTGYTVKMADVAQADGVNVTFVGVTTTDVKITTADVKVTTPEVKITTPEVKITTPEVTITTTEIPLNETTQTIRDLEVYKEYYFTVVGEPNGLPSLPAKIFTQPEAPGPVLNLTVSPSSITSDGATVQWERPEESNGPIDYYHVELEAKSEKVESNDTGSSYTFKDLSAYKDYTVRVVAVNLNDDGQELLGPTNETHNFRTAPGVPQMPTDSLTLSNPSETTLDLFVPNGLFKENMGPIVDYVLLVGAEGKVDQPGSKEGSEASDSFKKYNEATNEIVMYRSSAKGWDPQKTSDDFKCEASKSEGKDGATCKIGLQGNCQGFCNGALSKDTSYGVKIRGYTDAGYSESKIAVGHTSGSVFLKPSFILGLLAAIIFFKNQ